jgi:hypothetical protein
LWLVLTWREEQLKIVAEVTQLAHYERLVALRSEYGPDGLFAR